MRKRTGKGQRTCVICSCGSGFIEMGSLGRIVLTVVKKQRTELYLPGLAGRGVIFSLSGRADLVLGYQPADRLWL